MNHTHFSNSAPGYLYTTAQAKLVMHYILFSLQTKLQISTTKSVRILITSVIRINLNSEDLRLN